MVVSYVGVILVVLWDHLVMSSLDSVIACLVLEGGTAVNARNFSGVIQISNAKLVIVIRGVYRLLSVIDPMATASATRV